MWLGGGRRFPSVGHAAAAKSAVGTPLGSRWVTRGGDMAAMVEPAVGGATAVAAGGVPVATEPLSAGGVEGDGPSSVGDGGVVLGGGGCHPLATPPTVTAVAANAPYDAGEATRGAVMRACGAGWAAAAAGTLGGGRAAAAGTVTWAAGRIAADAGGSPDEGGAVPVAPGDRGGSLVVGGGGMAAVDQLAAAAAEARVCRAAHVGRGPGGAGAGGAASATAGSGKMASDDTGAPPGGAPARATRLAGERAAVALRHGRTCVGAPAWEGGGGSVRKAELTPAPVPGTYPGNRDAGGGAATRHGGGEARGHGPWATPPPGAAGCWGGSRRGRREGARRFPPRAPLAPSPGFAPAAADAAAPPPAAPSPQRGTAGVAGRLPPTRGGHTRALPAAPPAADTAVASEASPVSTVG